MAEPSLKNSGLKITSNVIFLLFFNYTYSIYAYNFNAHDDYHAYLVHPMKMIQSHTLGADPFNDRQMLSSFGGMSFLQTLIVSVV